MYAAVYISMWFSFVPFDFFCCFNIYNNIYVINLFPLLYSDLHHTPSIAIKNGLHDLVFRSLNSLKLLSNGVLITSKY